MQSINEAEKEVHHKMSTPLMESYQGPTDKNYEAVFAMADAAVVENEDSLESLKEA